MTNEDENLMFTINYKKTASISNPGSHYSTINSKTNEQQNYHKRFKRTNPIINGKSD